MVMTSPHSPRPAREPRARARPTGLLGVIALSMAITTACTASTGTPSPDGDAAAQPSYVLGGGCPRERDAVRNAEPRKEWSGDVDGDGVSDSISLVERPKAPKRCRTFVVVDTGDTTYSVNASVVDFHHRRGSVVVQVADLGGSPGVEIVLKQVATAIEWLYVYKVFTFHDGALRAVSLPGGWLIDDPFGLPTGAGCTPDGRIVISHASDLDPTVTRRVTQRFYELSGTRLRPVGREVGTVEADAPLSGTFPEFEKPLFGGC
jgi:hypothetical protein